MFESLTLEESKVAYLEKRDRTREREQTLRNLPLDAQERILTKNTSPLHSKIPTPSYLATPTEEETVMQIEGRAVERSKLKRYIDNFKKCAKNNNRDCVVKNTKDIFWITNNGEDIFRCNCNSASIKTAYLYFRAVNNNAVEFVRQVAPLLVEGVLPDRSDEDTPPSLFD